MCSFRSSADSDDTTFNHLHTFSSYCPLKIDVTASNTLLDYRSQFFRIHCCCRIFDFNMSLCRGSMNQATINEAHSRVLYFFCIRNSVYFLPLFIIIHASLGTRVFGRNCERNVFITSSLEISSSIS